MKITLTNILLAVALGYFGFTAWSLLEVFFPKDCHGSVCTQPNWSPTDVLHVCPGYQRLLAILIKQQVELFVDDQDDNGKAYQRRLAKIEFTLSEGASS